MAAGASDMMGAWQRDDGIARVKVASCGSVICMTNTFIRPDVTDEKVGERLEFDIKGAGGAALTGTVRDPKTGKSYSAEVTVAGETMTTRGCILGGVICKGQSWTRIR
jgi:uncharacterized protein (DUF2147 family)